MSKKNIIECCCNNEKDHFEFLQREMRDVIHDYTAVNWRRFESADYKLNELGKLGVDIVDNGIFDGDTQVIGTLVYVKKD